MLKTFKQFISFLFCICVIVGCHQAPEKTVLHFETLDAGPINDSLFTHRVDYKEDFNYWKMVYEHCMHDTLFHNAFYLGLQANLGLGSISNQTILNVNKQITVLDTSSGGHILDLLAVNNSANCFSKINLNKNLQDSFYSELIRNLKNSGGLAYLSGMVDSSQINFQVGTLIDFSIRPDSLGSLLERTKDSSLIYFRQMLTEPGNVLLGRTAMIFGFIAEFHLKGKLNPSQEAVLKNEIFIKLDDQGGKGSIQQLPDQKIKVVINKNYTVFGEFYVFR